MNIDLATFTERLSEAMRSGVLLASGAAASFVSVGAMVYLQEVTPEPQAAISTLIASVIQALTIGGGLATGGWFVLREAGKHLEQRRLLEKDERDAERLLREREYDRADRLLLMYVEREQRITQQYDNQIAAWQESFATAQTRHDSMMKEMLARQSSRAASAKGE
jgi:hypothetical protein